MSAFAEVTVNCDEPGCFEWIQTEGSTIAKGRAEAKSKGWRTRRSRFDPDYCPTHTGGKQ